jgi:DNA-binding XRE family transcriptional regulator
MMQATFCVLRWNKKEVSLNMDSRKRKRLEESGWRVGSVEDFLELSPAESSYINIQIGLAIKLKRQRTEMGLTQTQLALSIGSSQSRVAKMEAGDPAVSLDLLIRTLLSMGVNGAAIAESIHIASS